MVNIVRSLVNTHLIHTLTSECFIVLCVNSAVSVALVSALVSALVNALVSIPVRHMVTFV